MISEYYDDVFIRNNETKISYLIFSHQLHYPSYLLSLPERLIRGIVENGNRRHILVCLKIFCCSTKVLAAQCLVFLHSISL